MPLNDYTQPQNAGVQGADKTQESYDPTPEGVMKCIADIRTKLDALEAALGQEETQEPGAEPGATGAEAPMPPQTDAEIVAGIPPRKPPMSGMMGR